MTIIYPYNVRYPEKHHIPKLKRVLFELSEYIFLKSRYHPSEVNPEKYISDLEERCLSYITNKETEKEIVNIVSGRTVHFWNGSINFNEEKVDHHLEGVFQHMINVSEFPRIKSPYAEILAEFLYESVRRCKEVKDWENKREKYPYKTPFYGHSGDWGSINDKISEKRIKELEKKVYKNLPTNEKTKFCNLGSIATKLILDQVPYEIRKS